MNARLLTAFSLSCSLSLLGCPTENPGDTGTAVDASAERPDVFVPPGADAGPMPDTNVPTTVSFASDVSPIINASCSGSRCHNTRPSFLLGSTRCAMAADSRYVVPGNADASYVIAKITGGAICGSVMPPSRRLTTEQIATIRTWINEGALNN